MIFTHKQAQGLFLSTLVLVVLFLSWSLRPGFKSSGEHFEKIFFLEQNESFVWTSGVTVPSRYIETLSKIEKKLSRKKLSLARFSSTGVVAPIKLVVIFYKKNQSWSSGEKLFISVDLLDKEDFLEGLVEGEISKNIFLLSQKSAFWIELMNRLTAYRIQLSKADEFQFFKDILNIDSINKKYYFLKIWQNALNELRFENRFYFQRDYLELLTHAEKKKKILEVQKAFLKTFEVQLQMFIKKENTNVHLHADLVLFNPDDVKMRDEIYKFVENKKVLFSSEPLHLITQLIIAGNRVRGIVNLPKDSALRIPESIMFICNGLSLEDLQDLKLQFERLWIVKKCEKESINMAQLIKVGPREYLNHAKLSFVEVYMPALLYLQKYKRFSLEFMRQDLFKIFSDPLQFKLASTAFGWVQISKNAEQNIMRPKSVIDGIISYRL